MAPYTKRQNSTAIDDGWTITDGDGGIIAHLDTETMADALMAVLLQEPGFQNKSPDYSEGEPQGETEDK